MYIISGRLIKLILLFLPVYLNGEITVNGIQIDEKTNGTIITINLSNHISEEEISGWFNESGWFYLTLHGVKIDTTRSWPFSKTGSVTGFEIHQVAQSVQLNFELSMLVEDFEILSSGDGNLTLTLRRPLVESLVAVVNAGKKSTSQGLNIDLMEKTRWQDSMPFGLFFLGGGLTAKGILRSEKTTINLGVIAITAGWLLNSQNGEK